MCETGYTKTKPDPIHSKYNLFQDDVPIKFRIFCYNLNLRFTSESLLKKAAKISDFSFVEYIFDKELAWCSETHIFSLLKGGCHSPDRCLKYAKKYSVWHPEIAVSNLEGIVKQNRHSRFVGERRLYQFQSDDEAIGRCLNSTIQCDRAYVQQCAVQTNNLELFLNPDLYPRCTRGNSLTRRQVLDTRHKKSNILRYLQYTKEELESILRPPHDKLYSLELIKYLQKQGCNTQEKFPYCSYVLNPVGDLPEGIYPDMVIYLHKRGKIINQDDINKTFLVSIEESRYRNGCYIQGGYRPDVISYLYPLCSLENKRDSVLEVCTNDKDMQKFVS